MLMAWILCPGQLPAETEPEAIKIIKRNARSSVKIKIPDEDTFNPEAVELEKRGIQLLWTKGQRPKGARLLEHAIDTLESLFAQRATK